MRIKQRAVEGMEKTKMNLKITVDELLKMNDKEIGAIKCSENNPVLVTKMLLDEIRKLRK